MQLKNSYTMTQKEKLIGRIRQLPKDFTFSELETLLSQLGFVVDNKGKTSGSRIRFYHPEKKLQYLAHKPHPTSVIKPKALKDLLDYLTENNLL